MTRPHSMTYEPSNCTDQLVIMPAVHSKASRGSSLCSPTSSEGYHTSDVLTPISVASDLSYDSHDYGEALHHDTSASVGIDDDGKAPGPAADTSPLKRPRGRPRIHPPKPKKELVRTRTGCFTCRRRKKKCDETGFPCGNCSRTAGVECEGYPDQDARSPRSSIRSSSAKPSLKIEQLVVPSPSTQEPPSGARTLPAGPTVHEPMHQSSPSSAWSTFNDVARLFSVEQSPHRNPLYQKLIPLAQNDARLTNCLLYLSSCNALADQVQEDPPVPAPQHELREIAMETIMHNVEMANHHCHGTDTISDVTRALPMVLCLAPTLTGDVSGAYALHLNAVRHMATCRPSPDPNFARFVNVFATYVSTCHAMTSLDWEPQVETPTLDSPSALTSLPWDATHATMQPSYLCVPERLLLLFQRVTQLRHHIRGRRTFDLKPAVEPHVLAEASTIEAEMRAFSHVAKASAGSSSSPEAHQTAVQLVQLMRRSLWIYLHRTMSASEPTPVLHGAVDRALQSAEQLVETPAAHAVLLLPLFVLGCSAWPAAQRARVTQLLQRLYQLRRLPNITHAGRVLARMWQYMDYQQDLSWDWEAVMASFQVDFLLL